MNIIRFLIRFVRNSHTAGQIDKFNISTCLFFQFYSDFKQYFCQHRIVLIGYRVACQKCMNTEFLCSFCFQDLKCFKELFCGHTVFCISRVIHDIVADFKESTRIVTAADGLRNISDGFFQKINMGNIIQVDDCSQFCCILIFLCRCGIGREHNISSLASHRLRKHQFGHGGTVTSTSIFFHDLNQCRVRACFHCKVLSVPFVPCESFFYCFCIVPDTFFIIQMIWGWKFCGNLIQLFLCYKWFLVHFFIISSVVFCYIILPE